MEELQRGRESYAGRAWKDAYESLSRAERAAPLGAEDLERRATSAYMLGRGDDYLEDLERLHRGYVGEGQAAPAVRCAFWLGVNLLVRGEPGRATGWFSRARRLVEQEASPCVEQGYLRLSAVFGHRAADEWEAARAAGADAAELGQRFDDPDLLALGLMEQGRALARLGRVDEGLRLLDEAMLAVVAGEVSPIVTGLLYCSVIDGCQEVYAVRRAQEWTAALTGWCEQQPDMVSFTGRCLVHRAEIMQLHGAWADALEEARRAARRLARGESVAAAGLACYREGELHRVRGDLEAAEQAYREASRHGREPQPGLALLRLAQGRKDVAAAAVRRLAGEAGELVMRAAVLPAYVEIMLAIGEPEEAGRACDELEAFSEGYESGMLGAMVAQARGAIDLVQGDARSALTALRRAGHEWHELDAPYEAARVRVLIAVACRSLGDHDTAELELEAARGVFAELGAAPDLERVHALTRGTPTADAHGLTPRELQVLRLVSAGETNKVIAAQLVVSERTVDRHVSNIFAKLGVSSRAAATAYAYEHQLV